MTPRILIAGIGNIFLGDDGFGSEVARRLASRPLPPGVAVKDFGIRGLDLAYALLESYDLVLLIDACPLGGAPGTLYVLEPDPADWNPPQDGSPQFEAHAMTPMSVLRMVKSMGGTPGRLLIVGCEPADIGSDEEGRLGLTEPVQAAIEDAIVMIEAQVAKVFSRQTELQPQ
jgi:hydrogenase maturation protease